MGATQSKSADSGQELKAVNILDILATLSSHDNLKRIAPHSSALNCINVSNNAINI